VGVSGLYPVSRGGREEEIRQLSGGGTPLRETGGKEKSPRGGPEIAQSSVWTKRRRGGGGREAWLERYGRRSGGGRNSAFRRQI